MKHHSFRFIVILAGISLAACTDVTDQGIDNFNEKKLEVLVTGGIADADIFSVKTDEYLYRTHDTYSLVGSIYQFDNPQALDGGTATLAGIQIESDPNGFNANEYRLEFSDNSGQPLPTFGQTSVFALAGNSNLNIAGWETSFYLPDVVHISNSGLDNVGSPLELSKADGFTVTWNQDTENSLGVVVRLEYQQGFNDDRTGLPLNSVEKNIFTSDDGTHTITEADFDGFPVGARIWISVIRGNYKTIDASDGRKYLLYGATKSTGVADLQE